MWDHQNALLVDKMARGETTYNTRILVSPFPEEAAEESGDDYWRNIGYVPHLKRGFVQLYHVTEDGIISGSLSFDGSDKQHLREVFTQYGIEIAEEEITDNWLKYAITGTLSEEEAKVIATEVADQAGNPEFKKNTNTVDVTRKYRSIMDSVFNDSYVHVCESLFRGYQTGKVRELIFQFADKAHHFNQRYAQALYKMRADGSQFNSDDSVVLHELLVYSAIEMMRALHLKKTAVDHADRTIQIADAYLNPDYLQSISSSSFQNILGSFGAEGARSGRTYSACGLSISLGDSNINPDASPQKAYGGVGESEEASGGAEDKYGSLTFKCPKGHINTRPRNRLIERCKTCGTSVRC
jgi:hypothetical protein